MLLEDKNAVIYGGGGAIGGAAEVALLDAMDEHAVDRHADAIAAKAVSLDGCPRAQTPEQTFRWSTSTSGG